MNSQHIWVDSLGLSLSPGVKNSILNWDILGMMHRSYFNIFMAVLNAVSLTHSFILKVVCHPILENYLLLFLQFIRCDTWQTL